MTNLDSILKKRDITLLTKVHLVKAMIFHVWMLELYHKESWVQRNWCFWTVILEKTLESPLDWKEIQPVHPEGNPSWIFIGRTDAEAKAPILWPCPSPTPGVYSNSCPLTRWCHPTVSSSVVPFSSCRQSFPASGTFLVSQFFASGSQRFAVSASASVLATNIQDWSPLGWTGWIFLQSKGLSRVLSNITVQKHQFFGTQLSSQSNSHIHTWPLEKP